MLNYNSIKLPRGIKHSFWGVLDAALYPVVFLATVPILGRSMGQLTFGLWLLLSSIITIFQLFNFNSGIANLGVVAIRNIAHALVNNDFPRARDVINSLFRITAILLLFVSVIGIVLSYASVKYGWWGLKDAGGINVSWCVFLAVIIAGLKYFDQLFQSIIKAHEYFKLSAILNMINRFGLLIITLCMAINKCSLVEILLANVVFIIVYLVVQFCSVKWTMPAFKIERVKDKTIYKQLLNFSIWPWLQVLIIVLTFQTDRFWVSSYEGLKEISSYGLVATIFNHIHMILTAMVVWIFPRITKMASNGDDPARLYNIVRSSLFGIIIIFFFFLYFISPLLTHFLGAYAHMEAYIKGFLAFEIVFAHTIMPFLYLNAIGKERLATKATLFYCGSCYLLMLGGLWLFHNAIAMVAGMTIAMCFTMPVINAVVQQNMYKTYSWKLAILEMLPMYTAILLIYGNGNIWIYLLFVPVLLLLLWKFYLSNVFKRTVWQQIQ